MLSTSDNICTITSDALQFTLVESFIENFICFFIYEAMRENIKSDTRLKI